MCRCIAAEGGIIRESDKGKKQKRRAKDKAYEDPVDRQARRCELERAGRQSCIIQRPSLLPHNASDIKRCPIALIPQLPTPCPSRSTLTLPHLSGSSGVPILIKVSQGSATSPSATSPQAQSSTN